MNSSSRKNEDIIFATGSSRPLFDILPDELVLEIMSHLTLPDLAMGLFLICNKRIRNICRDPRFCANVKIAGWWQWTISRKVVLMVSGPHLRELEIVKWSWRKDSNDLSVLALARSPNLERLECGDEDYPSDALISALGREDSSVRKLCLNGTWRADIVTVDHSQFQPFFDTIVTNGTNLRNLSWITVRWNYGLFNDEMLLSITNNCKLLEYLAMRGNMKFNAQTFTYFLDQAGGRLHHLSLRTLGFGPELLDTSYSSLRHCRQLEELELNCRSFNVGMEAMKIIAGLAKLRKLQIFPRGIDGQDYIATFFGSSNETMHNNLTSLGLNFADLDDASLEVISSGCPNLEQLCLGHSGRVGDRGVLSVFCQCKKLARLCIDGTRVTAKGLLADFSSVLRLEHLGVSMSLAGKVRRAVPGCNVVGGRLPRYDFCSCHLSYFFHLRDNPSVGSGSSCRCGCPWSKLGNHYCHSCL